MREHDNAGRKKPLRNSRRTRTVVQVFEYAFFKRRLTKLNLRHGCAYDSVTNSLETVIGFNGDNQVKILLEDGDFFFYPLNRFLVPQIRPLEANKNYKVKVYYPHPSLINLIDAKKYPYVCFKFDVDSKKVVNIALWDKYSSPTSTYILFTK